MTKPEIILLTIVFGLFAWLFIFFIAFLYQHIRWMLLNKIWKPTEKEQIAYCLIKSPVKGEFWQIINFHIVAGYTLNETCIFVCWTKNKYQAILTKEIK